MKFLGEGEIRLSNGFGVIEDIGSIPLDEILALGAALTAAATVGIAALAAEETSQTIQSEVAEYTPQDRLDLFMGYLDKMGPEAQAELVKAIGPMAFMKMLGL